MGWSSSSSGGMADAVQAAVSSLSHKNYSLYIIFWIKQIILKLMTINKIWALYDGGKNPMNDDMLGWIMVALFLILNSCLVYFKFRSNEKRVSSYHSLKNSYYWKLNFEQKIVSLLCLTYPTVIEKTLLLSKRTDVFGTRAKKVYAAIIYIVLSDVCVLPYKQTFLTRLTDVFYNGLNLSNFISSVSHRRQWLRSIQPISYTWFYTEYYFIICNHWL